MHIPDGFLDIRTCAMASALSAAGLAVALRQTRRGAAGRDAPGMGLAAACVFTVQMLNFPVGAGTSAHLIGAGLAATLLGPARATVVMSCVLITQALLFGDGGVLTLGANLFNMAILAPAAAWWTYRVVRAAVPGTRGRSVAVGAAGLVSTVAAAGACAAELAAAGAAPWRVVAPAMVGVHLFVGIVEGIITAMIVGAVEAARPELLDSTERSPWPAVALGMVAVVGAAVFVTPVASREPDPVERLAAGRVTENAPASAVLADYRTPGVESPAASTAVAGGVGAVALFAGVWGVGRVLRARLSAAVAEVEPEPVAGGGDV